MAEKLRSAKRRGTDSTLDHKRAKKAKVTGTHPKKTASAMPIVTERSALTKKPPRKRAADYFLEESTSKEKHPAKSTESKKAGSKSGTKDGQDFEAFDSDNDEIPAQALDLFGEESDSDSESEGIELERLPPPPQEHLDAAKVITENKKSKPHENDGSGTLYIGHIPHGFYELQMRQYFSQFGKIKRLRLSRNRRTGAAKHYAFVEFESSDVADVVQKTMDKYLMFGHILQVRRVPDEQLHENLWKGANKRFKKIPWGDIQARKNAAPQTREIWRKRVALEEKRREKKKQIMEEYGYDFDIPELKQIDNVPSKAQRKAQLVDNKEQHTITSGDSEAAANESAASMKQASTADPLVGNGEVDDSTGVELKKTTHKKGKKTKGKKIES